jgi:hypothetical protein
MELLRILPPHAFPAAEGKTRQLPQDATSMIWPRAQKMRALSGKLTALEKNRGKKKPARNSFSSRLAFAYIDS